VTRAWGRPPCRRRLLDTALGNPLALLELPVSLGDLAQTVAGTLPAALPPGRRLRTAFASRVQALPASVYDLLLLAVLDGTGDLRLIRALAADRAGQGLESAERAGLVRADESTARLTFRHPLIRSAIVELSTSEQRRYAHAELAARLAGQTERYAWHLAEATEEPGERVAALLQEVAHANLRRGDSVGAVTELLRAAELSPSGKGRSGRLAEAAYLGSIVTGDLRDAPRLLEQARRARPVGPPRPRRSRHPHRPPRPPPPATAASTGYLRGCAWSSWPGRPSPNRGPAPPLSNWRSPSRVTTAGPRPGPHPAHLRLSPAPRQAHHRRLRDALADTPPE
jgi:hypothetical protein